MQEQMSQEQLTGAVSQEQSDVRTVVIAMDGSKFSRYAFQYYLENLHEPKDKTVLVHSVEMNDAFNAPVLFSGGPYAVNRSAIDNVIAEEERKTKQKLEEFADLLRDSKLKGTVRSAHAAKPGEGIVQAAKDVDACFIIIGSRGLGTIRRTFLGSVSDYVVHHAEVPVLVCSPK